MNSFQRGVFNLFIMSVLFWLAVWGVAQLACARRADCAEQNLRDLPYRAYDRVPIGNRYDKFMGEDASDKFISYPVEDWWGTTLMPADDWLLLDAPYPKHITGMRAPGHAAVVAVYRFREIPQEHPSIADERGVVRKYIAFLQGEQFPDSLRLRTSDGELTIPVWRGAKPPRKGGPQ